MKTTLRTLCVLLTVSGLLGCSSYHLKGGPPSGEPHKGHEGKMSDAKMDILWGKPVNDLQVGLRMDQKTIANGHAWTGKVYLRNTGSEPREYFPWDRLQISLLDENGQQANVFERIGGGKVQPPTKLPVLQPNEKIELAAFVDQKVRSSAYLWLRGNRLGGWSSYACNLTPSQDYRLNTTFRGMMSGTALVHVEAAE